MQGKLYAKKCRESIEYPSHAILFYLPESLSLWLQGWCSVEQACEECWGRQRKMEKKIGCVKKDCSKLSKLMNYHHLKRKNVSTKLLAGNLH